jgi:predicted nucleic acid-binding protein
VLSTLTINELLTHYYKRGRGAEAKQFIVLIGSLDNARFVPVDETIAEHSAGYRHGLGIPTVDSVILATFVDAGCDLMLTTDPHMQRADAQGIIKVVLLK